VIVYYSNFEVLTVVRFLQVEGVSQRDSSQVSVYEQNVFSPKEVAVWSNKFKEGRMALTDDPQKNRQTKDLTY
jgi:hypothetical protein